MRRTARRIDDDPAPRHVRLVGDGRLFGQDELSARIERRLPSNLAEADRDVIEAMVNQFADEPVGNGCVRRDRSRYDRLYVLTHLLRRIASMPPRAIAQALGLSRPYVKFALRRGKALIDRAKLDGRLDRALATLRAEGEADDDS